MDTDGPAAAATTTTSSNSFENFLSDMQRKATVIVCDDSIECLFKLTCLLQYLGE